MYASRLSTIGKAMKAAERNNTLYEKALQEKAVQQGAVSFLEGLSAQIKSLDLTMTNVESNWRESILGKLEAEILDDLHYVYPSDGYSVHLSTRVLRGKIHIDAKVRSSFSNDIPGRIVKTQGRLFQQVVSFAALIGVMDLLGVKTIYIDEAFSGSSKSNIKKLNHLLSVLEERGINLVMIAQDTNIATGVNANRLFLRRSIDNKTTIEQRMGDEIGE